MCQRETLPHGRGKGYVLRSGPLPRHVAAPRPRPAATDAAPRPPPAATPQPTATTTTAAAAAAATALRRHFDPGADRRERSGDRSDGIDRERRRSERIGAAFLLEESRSGPVLSARRLGRIVSSRHRNDRNPGSQELHRRLPASELRSMRVSTGRPRPGRLEPGDYLHGHRRRSRWDVGISG